MQALRLSVAAALVAAAPPLHAQAFQTPGMPRSGSPQPQESQKDEGQVSRFSSVFNPAFSFVVDAIGSYAYSDDDDVEGFDMELRTVEFAAQSWVDPDAWAYFVAASEDESVNLEEGAVHYTGLGGNNTLRAGRFFIDFGKQMQAHVHELRTTDRPLVLRAFLGEEVAGDGVEWDSWTSVGESTMVRWSIGAFGALLPEEQESVDESFERSIDERKDFGDLNFTLRLTGFRDVGEQGVLQLGTSLRAIPDYSVEVADDGLSADSLENNVFGVDATYGWTSDTGLKTWTFGTEALWSQGDTGFSVVDPDGIPGTGDEALGVSDDTLFGYYAFADYAWDQYHSTGLQISSAELPSGQDAVEYELYFTRMFSEFHRLRFTLAQADVDGEDDVTSLLVQYTAIAGAHGHGLNW